MSVGIRELRNTLSRQLARVRDGHIVTVTDHGEPIARIVPVEAETTYERLVREGRITPPTRRRRASRPPVVRGAAVSDLVSEQRR